MSFFKILFGYVIIYPIAQIYRLTIQRMFDALGNLWWCARIVCTRHWRKTSSLLQIRKISLRHLANTSITEETLQDIFRGSAYAVDGLVNSIPILDKWPTWTQIVRVHEYRKRIGNCQDHTHFAIWCLKQINKNSSKDKQWKFRKNIYVPLHPVYAFTKVHYFIYALSPEGIEYQISNGKVRRMTRNELASRILHGAYPFIWLTSSRWDR